MKKLPAIALILTVLLALSGCGQNSSIAQAQAPAATAAASSGETTLYGKVTAVSGSAITLALGTRGGQNGSGPRGNQQKGQQSNAQDNSQSNSAQQGSQGGQGADANTGATPSAGNNAQQSSGGGAQQSPADNNQQPSGGNGQRPSDDRGGPGMRGFTLTGETKTITLTDSPKITRFSKGQQESAAASDIAVDDILTITLSGDAVTSIVIDGISDANGGPEASASSMSAPGAPGGGMSGSSTGSLTLTGVYTVNGKAETSDGKTYESTSGDQNVVLVSNGSLTLTNATLKKSGNTSSEDESNFYGVNAILAAAGGSAASVSDSILSSAAEGSNAIFSTGEGSAITVKNVRITTTGNSSRGLDATYGGTIKAENVTISTNGAHCAPLATDRGEGVITVNGGTLSAAGDGSPCIYSTGSITVSNITGTATGSQAAVVEGKNSISISSSTLTGAGENGVMLYQSTSGDAAEGTAKFIATDSTLKTTSSGPMFYVTNTQAEAVLQNTVLEFTSGILANVAGNSTNNWGTPGSNGGNFALNGVSEKLAGDITCDAISTVALELTEGSVFTGAINAAHTGKSVTVMLDGASQWVVTGDSYVTALTDAASDCSNIVSNGHTVWYDASSSANAWLAGKTVSLSGGGKLAPLSATSAS